VLAIQGLNIAANDVDFLIQAQLVALVLGQVGNTWRFYAQPTPGAPNGTGAADQGPIINSTSHKPLVLASSTQLVVNSVIAPGFSPIANVTLHYRVMFDSEVMLLMNDAGTNGDELAGDGVWTGTIPAGAAAPGQLLRYYVTATDAAGNTSRWPIYPDSLASQQYLGTVVADPSVQSLLPVVQLFLEDPSAGDTRNGTRASLFFLGELYDNVLVRLHGQSSAGWPKKSHNLSFPKDHLFYIVRSRREKNLRLLSNYGDKMRMHTTLTYHTYALAGADGHFSFPCVSSKTAPFSVSKTWLKTAMTPFSTAVARPKRSALQNV
jgi:hypothetical protein